MATNKVSSLLGQHEIKVDVNASAEEFYHMFTRRTDLISDACTGILSCDLLDGEWGTTGSILFWNYLIGKWEGNGGKGYDRSGGSGEELDQVKSLEGDLMEHFKNFSLTLQVTPKRKGQGSIGSWYVEYEKISEEVADLETFMQLGAKILKGMDKHLSSEK